MTNTGNVTLEDLSVDDPKLAALGIGVVCDFPGANELAPGESVRCVADRDYTITAADEQAKHITNVATVRATTSVPPQVPIESPPSTTNVPVDRPDPKLSIVKTAGTPSDVNGSGITDAGDTLHFTFMVTNVGNVPVRQIVVDDPMLAGLTITCDATALTVGGPGASTECLTEEPYVVTAADVANGAVANSATANGRDPDDGPVRSPEDTTSTPTTLPQPQLSLVKTAGTVDDVNGSGLTDAGDTLDYTFVVSNVGNVPISAITLSDPKLTAAGVEIACTVNCAGPLAPGAERTFAASGYRITRADVVDGAVANRATAQGQDPDGGTVQTPPSVTTTPTTLPQPGITLDKIVDQVVDSNASGLTDAGDRITYEFVVRNTGNVPIATLRVADPALVAVGIGIVCDATTIEVGDEVTCRADDVYVVTEDDERAGAVANTATAHGADPDRLPVDSAPDSTAVPTSVPAPALKVDKSVSVVRDINGSGLTDAGDEIVYTFAITNTGNVPVFDLEIDDPRLSPLAITCTVSWIGPGDAPVLCTSAPYVVTEADEAAGSVANRATAIGDDPDGDPVTSPPDTTSTPTTRPQPTLTIEKIASAPTDVNDSGLTDAGDQISYTFSVTNTGNVPLDGVTVVDDKLAAQGITIACLPTRLLPREVAACTSSAPYRVSAADVADRVVANSATATATDPDGAPAASPPDTTATPTTRPAPGLSIEKLARAPIDRNGSGITDAGDRIIFTFTVTNTGNVPLDEVVVEDQMLSDAGIAPTCVVGCLGRLDPGAVREYVSAPYSVTAADVARGAVHNSAFATAEDPDGGEVESPPDTTSTPTTVPAPELALDKSVSSIDDVNGNGRSDAGDLVHFGFTVTNVGNVPITQIVVTDPMLGAVTCDADTLLPTRSTTCTAAPYEVTLDDVDQGSVINRADVIGVDPDDNPLPPVGDTEVVDTDRVVELLLDKEAGEPVDSNGNGRIGAGDAITYRFTVTNTGTVTVTDVAVDDPLLGTVSCLATSLQAGESTTCTAAPHIITEREMVAGAVNNKAVATGTGVPGAAHPALPVNSNQDQTTTPLVPVSRLSLVKEAELQDRNDNGLADAGEVVRYRFTITNTGTLRINKVRVVDPMLSNAGVAVTCAARSLEPGESTTCSADYTVRAADLGDGPLVNVAHAAGDTTRSPVSSADDAAEVRTASDSSLPDAGGFGRGWLGLGAALLGAGIVILVGARRRIRRGES
ncbi:hypothetical protein ACLM5J_14760 [Nocardioides sp. Bht2]|uniref:DUF7507 domain-containing protein n=1 Tax=Nocardioides sp. Bht2 TaxID=3392297 RepID=UPI0039B673ED